MSQIGWFVFSAGGVVCALLLGALWLTLRPKSTLARRYVVLIALAYALASVMALAHGAGRLLTVGYRPLDAASVPPGPRIVWILGSGGYLARDWDGNQFAIVDPHAASRVLEAARVFRLVNADWIVTSGGLRERHTLRMPSGESMRQALIHIGVPPDRIVSDTDSANTHDEAVRAAGVMRTLNAQHLILVTSDVHMRRSIGAFRAQGITPIPAIAHVNRGPLTWKDWLLPTAEGLYESGLVAHEAIGIGVYAWRGWYN